MVMTTAAPRAAKRIVSRSMRWKINSGRGTVNHKGPQTLRPGPFSV